MPEHIQNLLARLREPGDNPLSNDELGELLTGLRSHAREIRESADGLTDDSVATLQDIATAVGEATAAQTAIAEAATARATAADEALAAIGEDTPPAEPEGVVETPEPGAEPTPAEPTAAAPEPAAPAAPAEPAATPPTAEPTAVVEPAALPVAAAATPPARPTPRQAASRLAPALLPSRRPESTPAPARETAHATLVAAGGYTDAVAGTALTSMDQVADLVINAYQRMGSPSRAMVASLHTEYPEERRLRRGQTSENMAKIDAALSEAIAASGGICAPVAVDYTLPNWATTDRPIKAGLPAFQADRGGLTFVRPQGLSTWSDATSLWTEATDASPGTATKPVHIFECGDTDTVLVDAIPTRIRFGNMQGRYFPEQVAYNTQQALAVAAREAETNTWDKMITASTIAHAPQYLGATRDLLAYLGLTAVAIRNRGRMSESQRMRVVIHELFKEMLRADLAREIGHAQSGEFNALAVTDAMIEDWLNARNITPIWALDSPTARTISAVAIVAQQFSGQTAGAVLSDWPASCCFTMFPEGGFQFLDGGRLDLGVVRDSILDATNDYETFVEPFESVAFRAVEATTVVVPIVPNGASAGTVAPAEPTE